jgi:chromosomal replication initiation ATPase DnaA
MTDLSQAFADIKSKAPIRAIVRQVAKLTGIPQEDILSPKRDRATARARQMVMWKARQEGHSFPAIGKALQRDHTSVLHGVRAINRRLGL